MRLRSGLNVDHDTIFSNVRVNRDRAWLKSKLGSGSLAIVGGGPSLQSYVDKIEAPIMALNNAHSYLISRGKIPRYCVVLDARAENAGFFTNPHPDVTYLLASQVHPDVFEALEGFDVQVWHASAGGTVTDLLNAVSASHIEIGGGCTVGLRAMYLAHAIGYSDLHLYGYDSSFMTYHHAYPQPLNDDQDIIEVEVDGDVFRTSPTMAKQAYQFQSTVKQLSRAGLDITVHGRGLLPAIHQAMHRPVDQGDLKAVEARKYCDMWSFGEYRAFAPGEGYVDRALPYIRGKVIDFGCGTGRPAQKLKDKGLDVLAIDHAHNCLDEDIDVDFMIANLWDLPVVKGDFGFCTDVMEHIPPEKVDDVLSGISRCVDEAFFAIHTDHDAMGELIGEPLHLTVHDADWWSAKMHEHFNQVDRISDDHSAVFLTRGRR